MSKIEESVFLAEGVRVVGTVTIGASSGVWYNAVIRGDEAPVEIGECSNVQDLACLHGSIGHPIKVGSYVTIGHSALVHGCTVGDNTLIGMHATVLDGAVIGNNCIVGAHTLVTQGTVIPDNSLVVGVPGRVIRTLGEEAEKSNRQNAVEYCRLAAESMQKQRMKSTCVKAESDE